MATDVHDVQVGYIAGRENIELDTVSLNRNATHPVKDWVI